MAMKNIVVIGVGALGMRHLQSLLELKEKFLLYGVEPDAGRIKDLKKIFGDEVKIQENISGLPQEVELCIIATSSDVRRKVFDELTDHSLVRYVIFEKVLFQKKEDYFFVKEKLYTKGIKAWVNCPRREWPSYHWMKDKLKDVREFTCSVSGGAWGLCCNGIHMIDLLLYLADSRDYEIVTKILYPNVVPSKRKGFYELFGTFAGKGGKCEYFNISCSQNSAAPQLILIGSNSLNILIDEAKHKVFIAEEKNGWEWSENDFPEVYQSQLTSKIVEEIEEQGNCLLPDYDTSMQVHLKYLDIFMDTFENNGGRKGICPIT